MRLCDSFRDQRRFADLDKTTENFVHNTNWQIISLIVSFEKNLVFYNVRTTKSCEIELCGLMCVRVLLYVFLNAGKKNENERRQHSRLNGECFINREFSRYFRETWRRLLTIPLTLFHDRRKGLARGKDFWYNLYPDNGSYCRWLNKYSGYSLIFSEIILRTKERYCFPCKIFVLFTCVIIHEMIQL